MPKKSQNLAFDRRLVYCDFVLNRAYYAPLFFFFQAEDGIRDGRVTGVQTCALPISAAGRLLLTPCNTDLCNHTIGDGGCRSTAAANRRARGGGAAVARGSARASGGGRFPGAAVEIGRASCRERGEISVVAGSLKKKK